MFSNAVLMSTDFDDTAYLRDTLCLPNYDSEVSRLKMCVETITNDIRGILSDNNDAMLAQVEASSAARREVGAVRKSVVSLVSASNMLRHKIVEPYEVIQGKIAEMRNTSTAIELLRNTQKFLTLVSRLPELTSSDITRAARHLREVEDLLVTGNIRGIDVVDRHMETVERASATIRSRAMELLRSPPSNAQSASDVTVALQCFFTLDNLPKVVVNFMNEQKREVNKALMKELDLQTISEMISNASAGAGSSPVTRGGFLGIGVGTAALGGGGGAGSGGGAAGVDIVANSTRDVLLCQLERALSSATLHSRSVLNVWRVLSKKKDPATQVRYVSVLEDPIKMLRDFWTAVRERLRERLTAIQKRPQLQAALANAYVSFYGLLQGFLENVQDFVYALVELPTEASANGRSSQDVLEAADGVRAEWIAQLVGDLRQQFVAQLEDRHKERMHTVINKMMSLAPTPGAESTPLNIIVDLKRPHLPSTATAIDVRVYLKIATQDTMTYRQEEHTLTVVLNCITASIKYFINTATECTNKTPLPPLPSVAASVVSNQLFHICVANACAAMRTELNTILASLPDERVGVNGGGSAAAYAVGDNSTGGGTAGHAARGYSEKRQELWRLAAELERIANGIATPFFNSARATLDACVWQATQAGANDDAPLSQLHTLTVNFLSRFFYLFDPQIPRLDELSRRLTEDLLIRLVAGVALVRTLAATPDNARKSIRCVTQIPQVIALIPCSSSSRTLITIRGQLRQLKALISVEQATLFSPSASINVEQLAGSTGKKSELVELLESLHPLLRRLHFLQLADGARTLDSLLGVQPQQVATIIGDALTDDLSPPHEQQQQQQPQQSADIGGRTEEELQKRKKSTKALWSAVGTAMEEYESQPVSPETIVKSPTAVELHKLVVRLFKENNQRSEQW